MRRAVKCAAAGVMMLGGAACAGDLTAGDATLNLLGPVVFDSYLGDAALITDPGVPDQLYKYCWYYRSEVGPNYLFSGLDTPSQSFVGDTAKIGYTNAGPGVAGFARFNAQLRVTLLDGTQREQARVLSELVFTNINTSPRTYQVFHLVDVDLAGGVPNTAPDDVLTLVSGQRFKYREASSERYAEVLAEGAQRRMVGRGFDLRNWIYNTPNNLLDSGWPYSGDGAVAFQWTFTLQPGESRTIRAGLALNQEAVLDRPCGADLTGDGFVDDADFVVFATQYDLFTVPPALTAADFSGDGFVDDTDFVTFASAYASFECP